MCIANLALSILFGCLWIRAGGLKAREPTLFIMDIRSFNILNDPWPALLAMSLPCFEIICGVCVIFRIFYHGALVSLTICLISFLGAILSAQQRGLDITCGCFGKSDNATDYTEIITFDIVLLVTAGFLIWSAAWIGRRSKTLLRSAG